MTGVSATGLGRKDLSAAGATYLCDRNSGSRNLVLLYGNFHDWNLVVS
jgi:hypothetical protein